MAVSSRCVVCVLEMTQVTARTGCRQQVKARRDLTLFLKVRPGMAMALRRIRGRNSREKASESREEKCRLQACLRSSLSLPGALRRSGSKNSGTANAKYGAEWQQGESALRNQQRYPERGVPQLLEGSQSGAARLVVKDDADGRFDGDVPGAGSGFRVV